MSTARGFWSYVHADDAAEGGRIRQLVADVTAQYEMMTGESIDLFLDRDRLAWGDDWRAKIDQSLESAAFFIPVLTPRYFTRAECRHELNAFVREANRLGYGDLILPIMYMDFDGIHEDPPTDDAIALIKPFQWEDWRDLRFEERDSAEYRRAVARLATRLAEANKKLDEAPPPSEQPPSDADDDAPGVLELIATAEQALPLWTEDVNLISEQIREIGEIMRRASARLEEPKVQAKGFAGRIAAIRSTAQELEGPAERVRELSDNFTKHLNDVDLGMLELIPRIGAEAGEDDVSRAGACEFFNSVRDMAKASEEGLSSSTELIDALKPMEKMSRDLRKPVKTLGQALTSMREGREVISGWVSAMDETGLVCES